jgi:type VI secretion system ImpB/VipA family protein
MAQPEHMSIGLLADFAGHAGQPLPERRFISVDRDTFDSAIRAIRPEALLELPFCHSLRISSSDDFRPEQIAERVPALKALLYARDEVANPDAMRRYLEQAGASSEIEPVVQQDPQGPSAVPGTGAEPAAAADGDLLDSLLAPVVATTHSPNASGSSFDRMVRAIVKESGASNDFTREDARRAAIDEELGRRIRTILHHPNFQSLEASWCAARQIVRAGDDTPLRLFDLRLSEVVQDAEAPEGKCALTQRMGRHADPALSASRFSHLLCAMELGDDDEGGLACSHLCAVAADCEATLVVGVQPLLMRDGGLPSLDWRQQLAKCPTHNVILAHPQILLRLPYGEETDPIDEFDFEEFAAETEPDESRYLWGSAALALGIALTSWQARGGAFGEITALPIHVFRSQGEIQSRGPVNELLSESRIEALKDAGFACLVGIVGGDSVQVVGMRSLSA